MKELSKTAMIAFLASLILFPTSLISAPADNQGAKVKIRTTHGRYSGNLMATGMELLVIREKESQDLIGFDPASITRLSLHKSRAGKGVLIGVGVAAVGTGALLLAMPKGDNAAGALEYLLGVSAVIGIGFLAGTILGTGGGLIGGISGRRKHRLSRMPEEERRVLLRKLAQKALHGETLPEEMRSSVIMVR